MTGSVNAPRSFLAARVAFTIICLLAVGLIAFMPIPRGEPDPDDYLLFAKAFAEGRQGPHGVPSAFRPPGYPLVLATILRFAERPEPFFFMLHAVLTLLTLTAVWRISQMASLGWTIPIVAGTFVAVDPILVFHSCRFMTETMFTTLVCWTILPWLGDHRPSKSTLVLNGLFAGYGFLTRPTMAAIFLAIGFSLILRRRRDLLFGWMLSAAIAAAVVTPWVIRNIVLLGAPVFATTHGGYTLWLANNSSFYDVEVVQRRNWGGTSEFDEWELQNSKIFGDAIDAGEAEDSEVGRDRFQRGLAVRWMRDHPAQAARAALYRFCSFWSLVTWTGPQPFRSLVPLFYLTLFGLAACGWWLLKSWRGPWLTATVAVLAISLVHTIYWSNMRFRAPIEPLLAIWAAKSLESLWHWRRPTP